MPNIEKSSWQFVSASEQDTIELCKDNCRPATMYNVDSNVELKKELRVSMFEEATINIDSETKEHSSIFRKGRSSNY